MTLLEYDYIEFFSEALNALQIKCNFFSNE